MTNKMQKLPNGAVKVNNLQLKNGMSNKIQFIHDSKMLLFQVNVIKGVKCLLLLLWDTQYTFNSNHTLVV